MKGPNSLEGEIVIVANPAAQGGRVALRLRRMESALTGRVRVAWTEGTGDGIRLAAEAVGGGCATVVAAGGDGTVNEVANGIRRAGGGAALGVLPFGTMNVFARELRLPLRRPAEAWSIIKARRLRAVDCFVAGAECFVQMGGVGLDAAVVRQTSRRWKRWIGPLSYVLKGIELMQKSPEPLRVRVAGGREFEGAAVLFGNGKFFGGSVAFFPRAANGDGLLDVLVFRNQDYAGLLRVLEWIARRRELPKEEAFYLQTRKLSVSAAKPVPYELDGEWRGETPLEIVLDAQPLRVCVPLGKKAR
ncbi:MAG TPA: diacylglycerol kinase family protein [Verrucomicrobiales bacterium]|nr:diacylglycerol kinase family protein [Verrucomicrobiales bacterium]